MMGSIKKITTLTLVFFVLILTHAQSHGSECVFEGKVYPSEKIETIKNLYEEACSFFIETFSTQLDPEIKLKNVFFTESWKDVEFVGGGNDLLHALFYDPRERLRNDIYIRWKPEFVAKSFDLSSIEAKEVVRNSVIFHEIIHFLFKSSSFEYREENQIRVENFIMEESLAYWSQNEYIKAKTENDLLHYINKKTSDFKIYSDETFIERSTVFMMLSWEKFVHGSIHFINNDPFEKYNNIVKDVYKPFPFQ